MTAAIVAACVVGYLVMAGSTRFFFELILPDAFGRNEQDRLQTCAIFGLLWPASIPMAIWIIGLGVVLRWACVIGDLGYLTAQKLASRKPKASAPEIGSGLPAAKVVKRG